MRGNSNINCRETGCVVAFLRMMGFKVVVFVAAILIVCAPEAKSFGDTDDHPKMKSVQKACREKVTVDDEIYRRAAENGDMQTDDPNLQCYTKCVFQTARAMTEDGKINLTEFINGMKPDAKEFYGPILLSCQNEIEHEDLCVKGMKMYECFKKNAKEHFYFV